MVPSQFLTSLATLYSFLALFWKVTAVNVLVALTPPNTSQPLSSTLISFSIEQDRSPGWVGVGSRNEFTFNALDNYAKLTGNPPKLRIEADSQDQTTWSPDVDVSIVTVVRGFVNDVWSTSFRRSLQLHSLLRMQPRFILKPARSWSKIGSTNFRNSYHRVGRELYTYMSSVLQVADIDVTLRYGVDLRSELWCEQCY